MSEKEYPYWVVTTGDVWVDGVTLSNERTTISLSERRREAYRFPTLRTARTFAGMFGGKVWRVTKR